MVITTVTLTVTVKGKTDANPYKRNTRRYVREIIPSWKRKKLLLVTDSCGALQHFSNDVIWRLMQYLMFSILLTYFNNFERFASLSKKMVSASSLKIFKKSEKCPFQTFRTFIIELQVASKLFSKKLPKTKFWFK